MDVKKILHLMYMKLVIAVMVKVDMEKRNVQDVRTHHYT